MTAKVCLVEDDPTISELVGEKLRARGFQIDLFAEAEPIFPQPIEKWDLYIVDILLKGQASGLELCRVLRSKSPTVPILILSALSESSDRVEGLKTGADDYLAKPFEMEELLLRVDGMLKRRSWYSEMPKESAVFTWDLCSIDFVNLEGRRGYDRFPMSQKECMLMKLLIEREGQVVSRDEILDRVWGYNVYPSSRTVDNFILRLRKYFEVVPQEPKFIHSVRGIGYKFTTGHSEKT